MVDKTLAVTIDILFDRFDFNNPPNHVDVWPSFAHHVCRNLATRARFVRHVLVSDWAHSGNLTADRTKREEKAVLLAFGGECTVGEGRGACLTAPPIERLEIGSPTQVSVSALAPVANVRNATAVTL
jgi:hypothetical protein